MLEQSIMELLKLKFGANFLKEMKKKQPKRQAKKSKQFSCPLAYPDSLNFLDYGIEENQPAKKIFFLNGRTILIARA